MIICKHFYFCSSSFYGICNLFSIFPNSSRLLHSITSVVRQIETSVPINTEQVGCCLHKGYTRVVNSG